jgi:outer membrane murein-binding lipoprotein Lpp
MHDVVDLTAVDSNEMEDTEEDILIEEYPTAADASKNPATRKRKGRACNMGTLLRSLLANGLIKEGTEIAWGSKDGIRAVVSLDGSVVTADGRVATSLRSWAGPGKYRSFSYDKILVGPSFSKSLRILLDCLREMGVNPAYEVPHKRVSRDEPLEVRAAHLEEQNEMLYTEVVRLQAHKRNLEDLVHTHKSDAFAARREAETANKDLAEMRIKFLDKQREAASLGEELATYHNLLKEGNRKIESLKQELEEAKKPRPTLEIAEKWLAENADALWKRQCDEMAVRLAHALVALGDKMNEATILKRKNEELEKKVEAWMKEAQRQQERAIRLEGRTATG